MTGGATCGTCGGLLEPVDKPPSPWAKAVAYVVVAAIVLFLAGFGWRAILWSWGL